MGPAPRLVPLLGPRDSPDRERTGPGRELAICGASPATAQSGTDRCEVRAAPANQRRLRPGGRLSDGSAGQSGAAPPLRPPTLPVGVLFTRGVHAACQSERGSAARQPTPEERPAGVRRTQELGMSYKPIAPAPSSTPGSSTPGPGTPVPTGEAPTPPRCSSGPDGPACPRGPSSANPRPATCPGPASVSLAGQPVGVAGWGLLPELGSPAAGSILPSRGTRANLIRWIWGRFECPGWGARCPCPALTS